LAIGSTGTEEPKVCHSRNWLLTTSTLLVNGFWWGQ